MQPLKSFFGKITLFLIVILFLSFCSYARFGGAGGHSSGGSHSSHSSSHSYSSHSYGHSGHSYSGSGESLGPFGSIVLLVIIGVVIFVIIVKQSSSASNTNPGPKVDLSDQFPDGLSPAKVETAFLALQDAWERKDISNVRKWMSDGMYQRLTVQFAMMNRLSQVNKISDIRIYGINMASLKDDGVYQTADVAISFVLNDEFICEGKSDMYESSYGESATEYWTFIKRLDSSKSADLYHSENCPNCGASLENKLGEVSRCGSCNTLVNNAAYDWILSEVTQETDYDPVRKLQQDPGLRTLTQKDTTFSLQRMEDIASNVFMQTMEVMTSGDVKKLSRFADQDARQKIMQERNASTPFVFDRLFLNSVTLTGYNTSDEKLNLVFSLGATYRRVQLGAIKTYLDQEMAMHDFRMTLSKDLAALNKEWKEISFSHECPSCGAPYTDTTKDTCSYCDTPVSDPSSNWVLSELAMGRN